MLEPSFSSGTFNFRLGRMLFLATLLLVSLFCRPSMALSARPASPLAEIKVIIAEKALNPPSAESLSQLSMNHLAPGLESIDPYARYLPPGGSSERGYSSLRVGLELFQYKSRIWVIPEPGGPAAQQGMPEVGELRGVNNRKITDKLEQASILIDGAIDDNKLLLDVYDTLTERSTKYTIQPAGYTTSSVTVRQVGNYVFIRISDFLSRQTAPFFSGLYKTLDTSGSRIIIDLRGCPGGDIFEALEIAGMFVPAGLPLITTYDRTGKIHTYTSPQGAKFSKPVGILMDNRTASAAEILAGIFKKNAICPLVGQQSYGKCDSQTIFNLSNGGELWLTTLSIQFPDDTSCTQNGVHPDIVYPDISIARLINIKDKLVNE